MSNQGTGKVQDSYHSISTDHPLFEKLALSVFTTGSAMEFWNYQPPNSINFINRNYFGYGQAASPSFLFEDMGNPKQYHSIIYDIVENTHEEITDIFNNWTFRLADESTLTIGDVPLGSFVDKACTSMSELPPFSLVRWTDLKWPVNPFVPLPMSDVFGYGGSSLATLIEMNNWACYKVSKEGQSTPMHEWTDENPWSQQQFQAIMGFLASIKASKNNCLEWTTKVTFNLTPGLPMGHAKRCEKTEDVNFKLRLYDHAVSRDARNRIVQRGPLTNVSVPVREFGPVGKTVDGVPTDGQTETAQPLDVVADSISGKGRSGSLQCIAILNDELGPCKNLLNIDEISNTNAADDNFSIDDVLKKYQPTTGKATPLQAQNKNPNQWTPVWRNSKCNDGASNKPDAVVVWNFAKRTYAKGTTVMLNQMGGSPPNGVIWAVIDFGADPTIPVSQTFEGRWDFTTLIANGNGFFRKFKPDGSEPLNNNKYETFTPQEYETEFRQKYYTDLWNAATAASAPEKDDYARNLIFDGTTSNNPRAINFNVNGKGYVQMTSWDFLHKSMGGTRGETSIGTTVAELTPDGDTWEEREIAKGGDGEDYEPSRIQGFDAAPFFGSLIPNGYKLDPINGADDDTVNYFLGRPAGSNKFHAIEFDTNVSPMVGNVKSLWGSPISPDGGSPFQEASCSHIYKTNPLGFLKGETIIKTNGGMIPADIAVHSSPNGDNGRPITNIEYLNKYMTLSSTNTDEYFKTFQVGSVPKPLYKDQPLRYSWLARVTQEGGIDVANESWDLRPNAGNKVQFRPLMAETYLTFGCGTYESVLVDNRANGVEYLKNMFHMSERSRSTQASRTPVLGANLYNRASDEFKEHNSPVDYSSTLVGTNPPYSPYAYGFPVGTHIKWADDPHTYYAAGNFNKSIWGDTNSSRVGNPNAIGISSAVFTIKSVGKDSVSFEVDCSIGVPSQKNTFGGAFNNFSLILGGSVNINVSTGPTFDAGDSFYWGGGDNPWSFNTTNCHAKVWQAWPRNLTVFDSRFFVAHHFNAGLNAKGVDKYVTKTLYLGNKVLDAVNIPDNLRNAAVVAGFTSDVYGPSYIAEYLYRQGSIWSIDNDLELPNTDKTDGYVGEGNIIYPVDNVSYTPANSRQYEVDYKEPTYSNRDYVGTTADNSLVPVGTKVLRDGPFRDIAQWRVNPKCRLKLLPFKHYRNTIGVAEDDQLITVVKRVGAILGSNIPSARILVSTAAQTGYQVGDRFTTSGGSGKDVILEVSTTLLGAVTQFKVINGGHGFAPIDFMKQYNVTDTSNPVARTFNVNSTSPVKLKPLKLKGLGKGLQGWVVYGEVVQREVTHAKPAECGSNLISPSTKNSSYVTLGGLRQSVAWDAEDKSPDDKYDVMMWFHNDISHTFQYHGDYGGHGPSYQQWLTVNPLPE